MLHRVFDLFTQVDPTLDRSQGGLGIGLTLVRSSRSCTAAASPRRAKAPAAAASSPCGCLLPRLPEKRRPRVRGASGSKQRRKILVVDDNLDTARSAALLLETAGHTVEMAHDGFAAQGGKIV